MKQQLRFSVDLLNKKKKYIFLGAFGLITSVLYLRYCNHWMMMVTIYNQVKHLDHPSLVDSMTNVLVQMLNVTSDMKPFRFTHSCNNIWPACLPDECSRHLSLSPRERVSDILSPKLTLTDEDHQKIVNLSSTIPVSDVIFISATSDNHYDETQAMVHSLHKVVYPRLKNMTFVLFDIGLTAEQRNKTLKACRCHLISFPFDQFPNYFKDLKVYTWKPIIVKASMIKARKLLVYQDASISWKDTVLELLDRADKLGLQLWGATFMLNIPVATLKGTFDYFGDQPCAYLNYTQVQSGIELFKQSPFIVRTILEPWAKCALERECFIPNVTSKSIDCTSAKKEIHMCHRFDQSVLSMIVTKLFTSDRYRYHMPESENWKYLIINRVQRDKIYFNNITLN